MAIKLGIGVAKTKVEGKRHDQALVRELNIEIQLGWTVTTVKAS